MTAAQIIEATGLVAGVGLVAWQFRWLLRAYRTERDRQPLEQRSSRLFVLALALTVFVALASITNMYAARRLAVWSILAVGVTATITKRFAR